MTTTITAPAQGWQFKAKCRNQPPELYDLTRSTKGRSRASVTKEQKKHQARQLCEGCPVLADCAKDVLENDSYGLVRAGLWSEGWLRGGHNVREAWADTLPALRHIAATGEMPQ